MIMLTRLTCAIHLIFSFNNILHTQYPKIGLTNCSKMMSSQSVKTAKKALRTEVRKILAGLSTEEKTRQSKIIAEKLFSHEKFLKSKRVSVYLSLDKEVDTQVIVEKIFQSGKECFIPKYNTKADIMEMVKVKSIQDLESLPMTSWNIRQPSEDDIREEAIATGGLDLMIVPGLAFTKEGHRLGQGKGFYDNYFKKCSSHCKQYPYVIALAFKQQVFDSIPFGENDVKVNQVITSD